jgi:hypothetical protein
VKPTYSQVPKAVDALGPDPTRTPTTGVGWTVTRLRWNEAAIAVPTAGSANGTARTSSFASDSNRSTR